MTDIVATIQGEQDRIIRADLNQAVVVQGGPGTGKTAGRVASRGLPVVYASSRVAAFRSAGGRPSSTFLHYIDQVLPSLGETGVVSRTIADLIPGIIATAHDDPHAAKLKGERRMAKAIANAVAARDACLRICRSSASTVSTCRWYVRISSRPSPMPSARGSRITSARDLRARHAVGHAQPVRRTA